MTTLGQAAEMEHPQEPEVHVCEHSEQGKPVL